MSIPLPKLPIVIKPPAINTGLPPRIPRPLPPPPPPTNIVDVSSLYANTNPSTLNKSASGNAEQQASVAGLNSLVNIIYGRRRTGSKIINATMHGEDLIVACLWGHGECDAVESVTLGDTVPVPVLAAPIGTGVLGVTNYLGTNTQNPDATLVAAFAAQGYTFADNYRGFAYSVLRVPPGVTNGWPYPTALVRGIKTRRVEFGYIIMNGTSAGGSVPDATQNRINEDFEIVVGIAATDYTPASDRMLVAKWDSAGNKRAWRLYHSTTGTLVFAVSGDGVASTAYTSTVTLGSVGITDGSRIYLRVRFRKTNGSNSVTQFHYSADSHGWTQLGADVTGAVVATIFASDTLLRFGRDHGGSYFAGNFYQLRIVTASKLVCDFQAFDVAQSATSFTDESSAQWTLANCTGNASLVGWSRYPINHLIDFCSNPVYGAGGKVDHPTALATYALNSTVLAGPPPEARHQCDLLVDSSQPVVNWISTLRDYAHCWVVREADRFYFPPDVETASVVDFTTASVLKDSLRIQKRGSRNQPTCMEITYTDTTSTSGPWRDMPVSQFRPGVLSGTVPRRMSRVSKPGLVRYSEANRYGIERLNESTTSDLQINFVAFDAGAVLRSGDMITITHPIGFDASKKWRVLKVDPTSAARYSIFAVEFDPLQYSTTVVAGPSTVDTTLPLPNAPPAVTGVTAVEDLYQTADSMWSSRISVTWTHTTFPFVSYYRVEIYDGSTLVYAMASPGRHFITPPLKENVSYSIRVAIISTVGAVGGTGTTTFIPLGKFIVPTWPVSAALTGFEVGGKVFLYWPKAVDVDTLRYDLRRGTTNDTFDTAVQIDYVDALTFIVEGLPAGVHRFFVKAVDTVQNYTATALSVDVIVSTDSGSLQQTEYTGGGSMVSIAEYALRDGTAWYATDWADGMDYGAGTIDNAVGTFNDGLLNRAFGEPVTGALFLSGSTGYINVPHVAAYNTGTTHSFGAWVFLTGNSNRFGLWSTRSANAAGSWQVEIGSASGTPGVAQGRVAVAGGAGTTWFAESIDGYVPLRNWTHVMVVISGTTSTSCTIYVNGVEVTYNQRNAFTCVNNGDAKRIGQGTSGTQFLPGLFKHARLYNVARTAAGVRDDMGYNGIPPGATGCIGLWKADTNADLDATTTLVTDSSATANNGTLNGSFQWRSRSACRTALFDYGTLANGIFTLEAETILMAGASSSRLFMSTDGVSYTTYNTNSVRATARYFFGEILADSFGSIAVKKSSLKIRVGVAPREESGTFVSATGTTGATVALTALFAKCINIPIMIISNTGYTYVCDQIETAPTGIAGGVYCARLLEPGTANKGRLTRNSFTMSNVATYECWARLDIDSSTDAVFTFPNTANTTYYRLVMNPASGGGYVTLEGNGFTTVTFPIARRLTTGKWTHVAISIDRPNLIAKLYYDGVLMDSATIPTGADPTNASAARTWGIGTTDGTVNSWSGHIYEFRVWNEIRSAAQIAANYATAVASGGNLSAYWRLNNALTDSGGAGLTLTASGTSAFRPINGFDCHVFDMANVKTAGLTCNYTFRGT